MTTASRFLHNALWLTAADIFHAIIVFVLTILLTHNLPASDFGQLMFALSITTLFSVLLDLGLNQYMIRTASQDPEKTPKLLHDTIVLRCIFSILFLVVVLSIVALSRHDTSLTLLTGVMALYVVLLQLSQSFYSAFRAQEHMRSEALSRIIASVILLLLTLLFLAASLSLYAYAVAYVITGMTMLVTSTFFTEKKMLQATVRQKNAFPKKLLRSSLPFTLSLLFTSIYYYMDASMLGLLGLDVENGWYVAIYKMILFILLFGNAIGNSMYPLMSRVITDESPQNVQRLTTIFLRSMILLIAPIIVGGMLLSEEILLFIYPPSYLGGLVAFRLLLLTSAIIYISIVVGISLQAHRQEKVYMRAVGMGAGMNIILNFLLIPLWSLNGAALATLLTELLVVTYLYTQTKKNVAIPLMRELIKPSLAALGMGIVLILIPMPHVTFSILFGIILYTSFIFLLKGLHSDEITMIKKFLNIH